MESPIQRIAATVTRGCLSRIVLPRRCLCFQQTLNAPLPTRHNTFASNRHLANLDPGKHDQARQDQSKNDQAKHDQTKHDQTAAGGASDVPGDPTQDLGSSRKRKSSRSSASKKLRKASMTKKMKDTTSDSPKPASADLVEDDTDYQKTIRALCVAQSFDMAVVKEILGYHGFEIDPDGTDFDPDTVIHARSFNNGDIFVFNTGTVVAWSVPADTVKQIATKQLVRAAEYPHIDQLEMEDLEYTVDNTRDTSYVRGEEIVLGTKTETEGGNKLDITLAKIAFSSGLARSPKLAYLEKSLTSFLESARIMSISLSGGSELTVSRRFILKKTGELLSLRSKLNHYSELTDSLPDMFWDKESRLEGYYERVGNVLDVRSRITQLNKKIDYAHETASIMREMSSEKHSIRLEWIIIWLIAVEVLFELRRVYKEEFSERSQTEVEMRKA